MKNLKFAYERKQSWQAGHKTTIGDCATIFSDTLDPEEGNEGVLIPKEVLERLTAIEPIKELSCWGNPKTYHISVVEGRNYLQVGWGSNRPSQIVSKVVELLREENLNEKIIKESCKGFSVRKGVALTNILLEIFGYEERVILTQQMLDEEKEVVIARGTANGKEWAKRYKMDEVQCIENFIDNATPWEEYMHGNGGKGNWDIKNQVKIYY